MDSEALQAMFDRCPDGEYLEFSRIPEADRLYPAHDLCGLLKVASLLKEPQSWEHHAEHDILYLASAADLRDDVTEADVLYLVRCGIHYDEENDCLVDFC